MEEIIAKIKHTKNLSEFNDINPNILLLIIVKCKRFDLLNDDIRISVDDSLDDLIDFLLKDEDILYYMHKNNYFFTTEELNVMFNIIYKNYSSYSFEQFLKFFFAKEQLNTFIKQNEQFFKNYIYENEENISYYLRENDAFIEILLNNKQLKLIRGIENYSLDNLKLLAKFSKNSDIPYYLGNDRYLERLFELKSSFSSDEFINLLDLLKEKSCYERKINNSTSFANLIKENIDYLIEILQNKILPKCLIESSAFRDECIKRNRIDIAFQCILPPDIMQNETLVNEYCKKLNIDSKDFHERTKWLLNYYKKNNNIFNTFLATSLKNNIFNLNIEHYERFINDVEIQISLSKLNNKELIVLSKILNIYSYKDYDISSMIFNIINNIKNYQELVDSLDLEDIKEKDLRMLVSIFQLNDNQFQINNIESLQNYDKLKKQFFINNFSSNDLIYNKDCLLKVLFNINLKEAQYINSKYCHNDNLDILKNSELQPQIYNYLELISKIINCNNVNDLFSLYTNDKIYDNEIPLESYIRSKYTELYSKSLYRIDEIYGPKDNILTEINFNGKNVQICIPRENFNFLIHCVGTCSIKDINYNCKDDWLNRPQIQDHFIACSYINEKGVYSIREQGSIIFGFNTLENGSILGMGNTDIDSIGRYANAYDGSRQLQEGNNDRAKFFVPSEILKSINNGYNEIIIERRNTNHKNQEFKRNPNYIIMMTEEIKQDNFTFLETLYQNQLSFISNEDKKIINQINNSKKIKEILIKYKNVISQIADEKRMTLNDMVNWYVKMIINAKYFENCVTVANDFDIPLVIIDKTHYFKRLLATSTYSDNEKNKILKIYLSSSEYDKKKIFNMVAKSKDLTQLIEKKLKV